MLPFEPRTFGVLDYEVAKEYVILPTGQYAIQGVVIDLQYPGYPGWWTKPMEERQLRTFLQTSDRTSLGEPTDIGALHHLPAATQPQIALGTRISLHPGMKVQLVKGDYSRVASPEVWQKLDLGPGFEEATVTEEIPATVIRDCGVFIVIILDIPIQDFSTAEINGF